MIYTDGTHVITDATLDELHEFAQSIGLRRAWFQDHPRHPHYDTIAPRMQSRALRAGAKKVSPKEIVRILTKVRISIDAMAAAANSQHSENSTEVEPVEFPRHKTLFFQRTEAEIPVD